MIHCGIVGVTGYTGIELWALLKKHPNVQLDVLVSKNHVGKSLGDVLPNHFSSSQDQHILEALSVERLSELDLVFFATPHGVSMRYIPKLIENNVVVIDLSADFRLSDPVAWNKWYGLEHQAGDYLSQATYGLTEFYQQAIACSNLIACPGCYPTAVNLGLIPLVRSFKLLNVIADCKSGVSGAGRQPNQALNFCDIDQNLYGYGVGGHRHFVEIEQQLAYFSIQDAPCLTFMPHIVPMVRGIYATLYVTFVKKVALDEIYACYEAAYADKYFIEVLPPQTLPRLLTVYKTNHVSLGVSSQQDIWVIGVAMDNLLKGAAGQAVQNMNIRFDWPENMGL